MYSIQSEIERAKKGEQSSFYALYSDTYPKNRYIALKYMKQESDADDVLQDAYIKIFRNLDKFSYNGERSFQSWTSKIVSNTALNHLRRKNPVLFSETEDEDGNSVILNIEDDRAESQPELSYEKSEVSEIVSELLNDLSEEQRIVVMMYYYQEYSVKEIASECSCNENTVKSRLNYARKKLETKATDLKKKGILTSAFTMAALYILLREDSAKAATKSNLDRGFGALCKELSASGVSKTIGVGETAVSGTGHFFTAKTVATIAISAVVGAGIVTGVLFAGGFFSHGQDKGDDVNNSVPMASSTPSHTVTPTPMVIDTPEPPAESTLATPDVTPEATPEETPIPEKTKKPKKTPKPTKKPEPTPRRTKKPEDTPEPVDWDDSPDWDDDFTEWED